MSHPSTFGKVRAGRFYLKDYYCYPKEKMMLHGRKSDKYPLRPLSSPALLMTRPRAAIPKGIVQRPGPVLNLLCFPSVQRSEKTQHPVSLSPCHGCVGSVEQGEEALIFFCRLQAMESSHSVSYRLSVQKVISSFLSPSPARGDRHVMANTAVYQR